MHWPTLLAGRQVSPEEEGIITLCFGLLFTFVGWMIAVPRTGVAQAMAEWRHQARRDVTDPFRREAPTPAELAALRTDLAVTRLVGTVFALIGPLGIAVGTYWILSR